MRTLSTSVVVVGLGPGGGQVAEDLAAAGVPVVAVDDGLVGGECPYWGCVPSKRMVRAAGALAEARRVDGLAGTATVVPDWAPVHAWIADVATDHWDDRVAVERLEGKGATFVRGRGRLDGPRTVVVSTPEGEDVVVTATTAVVLGTGSAPARPPIEGLAGTPYWTNHEFVESPVLPRSCVVLGGGAIGCELAQVMARFGVRVTVVEPSPRLLGLEEPAAGELLADVFSREGITVRTGVGAARVGHDDDGFTVTLSDGSAVTAERLLVAAGRRVDLAGLGVASLGVDDSARTLSVDDRLRVLGPDGAIDGVYALGDLVGQGAFTHVAVHHARVIVAALRTGTPTDASNPIHALPRVTFTDPEIGAVGLTEQQARDRGLDVQVAHASLESAATRGWIHGPGNDGFLTVVAHDGVLVGATSAGPGGGEVLGALSVAVQARIPVADLRRQVWAYPTLHRGIEAVLAQLPGSG
ncbi:MAG: NAD(P)/FAD-dependent oxidoreductase [Frankiales bacterium]|nr:NAD(P)/FAD-dependent oxidoreductase [Frankiales bacterium]